MKTPITPILLAGLLTAGLATAVAQTAPAPTPAAPAAPEKIADKALEPKVEPARPEVPAPPTTPAPTPVIPSAAPVAAGLATPPPAPAEAKPAPFTQFGGGLRLNFRGVPLDMVLNYLSEAAGFNIVVESPAKGTVEVWSNRPVSKDEAVALLNQVLNKNGLAAIRNDKTLTIVTREEAKKRDIPVKKGAIAEDIPKNDEIVTQIIPVQYISATQLIKDLQPLLPTQTSLTANESGNAIVLTDTQTNIRRMVEIINAIDTSTASSASIKVFPLRYADAKELATSVKELFQTDASSSSNSGRTSRFGAFFGGGPPGFPGGFPGGDRNRGSSGSSSAGGRPGAGRVAAVSDERSNSLVVTAPADIMPTIEQLVKEIDVDVEDITELKVFRLKYSDPVEMSEVLANLFPDETQSSSRSGSSGSRFGSFGGSSRFRAPGTTSNNSERAKKQGRVLAVPDRRTASVIVTASRDMMKQIELMITQLDSDPAKKQSVYVYPVENADVQQLQSILQSLFTTSNSRSGSSGRSGSSQNSPLTTRAQQQSQTQSGSSRSGSSGSSSSGLGGGSRSGNLP